MAGIFDIVSVLCFSIALGTTIYTVLVTRGRVITAPETYLLLAMAIMTYVGISNSLEHLGITAALDPYEDYAEVFFLPMMTYVMYSLYARSQAARIDHHERTVGQLGGRLAESLKELGEHRLGMLQALTAAVDARDHYTALHSMHVADYASAIAYRLGMRDQLAMFEQAGLLHDIGKIGVPDTVLLKPARLTDEEYEAIKKHVEASATILAAVPFLADVTPAVRHHHERWNGSGYPDGLAGAAIPRAARILAVADAFDAMTTDRPYRAALDVGTARAELVRGRGIQWDPEAVDSLLELLDEGVVAAESRTAAA
jgi:putative nucleotidyltransferase with HDIG domain